MGPRQGGGTLSYLSRTTVAMHNSLSLSKSPSLVFHNQVRSLWDARPFLSTKPQILWVLPRHAPPSTPPHCCQGTSYPEICYLGAVSRCFVAPREFPHPLPTHQSQG